MKSELLQLSVEMDIPEYSMLQDIQDGENGFNNPAYGLTFEEYKKWLVAEDNHSKGVDLPKRWEPYTTYFLYIDNVPVGYGRVRHASSEYLEKVLGVGNLGYGIAEKYRGKGYGNILFRELLNKCRDIGYKKIKLFPDKNNLATLKVMKKNGGSINGDFDDKKYIIEFML